MLGRKGRVLDGDSGGAAVAPTSSGQGEAALKRVFYEEPECRGQKTAKTVGRSVFWAGEQPGRVQGLLL